MLGKAEVSISEIIRMRRVKLGLTQDFVARAANIPLRTFQDIEAGKSEPRYGTLRALAKPLSLTTSDLWGEADPMPRLSPSAIPGPLLASDVSVIVAELERITPAQRSLIFAILFRDESLFLDGEEGSVSAALRVLQKAE